MTNGFSTTGVSTTNTVQELSASDLAPNNYLTIIWKDKKTGNVYSTLDIDDKEALDYTISLSSAIESAINNGQVSYAGQNKYVNLETIGKYVAQNTIPAGTKRTVVNSLIGLASGGKEKLGQGATNLLINTFGTVADKTARSMGFTDPHELFSQVTGENTLTVFKQLGDKTKDFLDNAMGKITGKSKETDTVTSDSASQTQKYIGLLLGLTTSDSESYSANIPRRKVEDGSDYTTHIITDPFKKDFTVKLTNKVLSSDYSRAVEIENIESAKDKLIEIFKSKVLFDIYIRLSEDKIYKRSNVYFTSLNINKDETSGNSYTVTFTIEPINSFKSKVFISNIKYGKGIGGSSKGTGSSSIGTGNANSSKGGYTADGDSLKVGYVDSKDVKNFKNKQSANKFAKDNKKAIMRVFGEAKKSMPEYMFIDANEVVFIKDIDAYVRRKDAFYSNFTGKWDTIRGVTNSGNVIAVQKFVYAIIYYP